MSAYRNRSPVIFTATLASVDTICGLARAMPPTLGLIILRALERAIEAPPAQPTFDQLPRQSAQNGRPTFAREGPR